MSQTAITKRITTISEAEKQFNLVRTADVNFFLEWTEDSINLTDSEKDVKFSFLKSKIFTLRFNYLYFAA
ncbi:hypothetical protein [Planktothrix agardhii]|jgi:hypothetical protein|uniref:hypothetical protein n=1 Tax=Planktothrix agardhii TaxID=1160 RepID=UPI002B1EFC3B|nr:hypothetical protein [Planktothrix agardhii]MEA5561302.1 hypothetical protein [Planktothrix agardhii UHCC 0887]